MDVILGIDIGGSPPKVGGVGAEGVKEEEKIRRFIRDVRTPVKF